jgi:quinol monooxygenase YgiN
MIRLHSRAARIHLFTLLLGVLMTIQSPPAVKGQPMEALYVVSYLEVMPASKDNAAALLKQWSGEARRAPGSLRVEVLQGIHRPNQFVIAAVWKDQKAFDDNVASAPTKDIRERLQPHLVAPLDTRMHKGFALSPGQAAPAPGAIYVVTHVDVPPPSREACEALLRQLAEGSQKEAGAARFDVYQQTNRPNHFTVVEAWKDQGAMDAHAVAAHTKEFRQKLGPMLGALYDDRLFKAMN